MPFALLLLQKPRGPFPPSHRQAFNAVDIAPRMSGGPTRFAIPTPLPVGPVNAYYLPGKRPALVDAGPRDAAARRALEKSLADLPIDHVVVTHQHADHFGLVGWVQREKGAEVLVHAADADALRHWTTDAQRRERDYVEGYRSAGVPEAERERMRYGGRKYDDWAEPVEPDRLLRAGDRVEMGDQAWDVVDAPGHTPGSFLLHNPELRSTFSGDTLLEHITPNAVSVRASERGSLAVYWATLERLVETDWGRVHPGHGRPFQGSQAVIRKALVHARRHQARVLKLLEGGETTAYELVRRMFPHLAANQLFLAVSEALGHLEILRRNDRVGLRRRDGRDWYRVLHGQP